MIIFGTRVREKAIASGQFTCPNCRTGRPYSHKRVMKYFALYFIPIFKTSDLGEYIECQVCHQKYNPEVLTYKEPSPAARAMAAVKAELDSGLPLHMARQKLIDANFYPADADDNVKAAVGENPVTCPKCGFIYKNTIRSCSNCGTKFDGSAPQ
jgi:transcription elongation factor Elf1